MTHQVRLCAYIALRRPVDSWRATVAGTPTGSFGVSITPSPVALYWDLGRRPRASYHDKAVVFLRRVLFYRIHLKRRFGYETLDRACLCGQGRKQLG